jgi:predicted anti-sigma-YlaC factor YlaD
MMNCKKAEEALLRYAEKTIKPAAASALAKHILTCGDCREAFLAFDEALESMDDCTEIAPPSDFTETTMAAIRKLPAYRKASFGAVADTVIRVFWGLCAVLMGFGLLGMGNPEVMATLLRSYPRIDAVAAALNAAGDTLKYYIDQFLFTSSQIGVSASVSFPWLTLSALFFVGVVGAVLAVLLRGENLKA